MMAKVLALILVAVAGLGAPVAWAHHGWGSYDASKPVTVAGKILTSKYENPHVALTVQAPDKVWTVTLAPTSRMTNRGALVQVGDVVQQGQPIGLSGHTGNSSGPHLHVDLTRSCCATAPDYNAMPQGETLPLSFSNASPDSSCGLRNESYTALP